MTAAFTPMTPVLVHAGMTHQCGTFIPEDDGPAVLMVGSLVSADRVRALARRHGLDEDKLLAFAGTDPAA